MDLSALKLADKAMPMELLDMDGEPMATATGKVVFMVHGTDSTVFKNLDSALTAKRLRKMAKKKKTLINALADITPEEQEAERIERIAVCIAGWENVYEDGEPLDYTPENAARLVAEYAVIADQVEAFATDRANFTRR